MRNLKLTVISVCGLLGAILLLATLRMAVRSQNRPQQVEEVLARCRSLVRVGDRCVNAERALADEGFRKDTTPWGDVYWKDLGLVFRGISPESKELEATFECEQGVVTKYRVDLKQAAL